MTTILIVYTILFLFAAAFGQDRRQSSIAVMIGFALVCFIGLLIQDSHHSFARGAVGMGVFIFTFGAIGVLPRGHTVAGLLALGWAGWGIYVLCH